MDQENRVVVLVDMDCFYCQVEQKLNPVLAGKPIAVVQYNPWKGGGIIAVNYEARAMGVTRNMRGDEAKEKCPNIQLPSVPCLRGKADISKYRDAGKEVAQVLQKFTSLLERASIDEAYLDITIPVQERLTQININLINKDLLPNTFALGYDSVEEFISDVHCYGGNASIDFDYEHAKRLLIGALIVSEIRTAVYKETGYQCSAGIAHNKILAKLVCGMNKPNKQTVLPKHSINILFKTLPIRKVKHLGGKFGLAVCEQLKIIQMGELQQFSEKELQTKIDEKNGTWLYNIARGIDLEPVQARFNPKSIGCCKQFRGKSTLYDLNSLKKWLKDLGDEIEDRLEKDALDNNRTPKQMVVSFSTQLSDGRDTSNSRSYNFLAVDELCGELFSSKALELILDSAEGIRHIEGEVNRKLKAPIKFLGISVGKFEDNTETKKTKKILDYFCAGTSKDVLKKDAADDSKKYLHSDEDNANKSIKNGGKEYLLRKFFHITENQNFEHEDTVPKQYSDFKMQLLNDSTSKTTSSKQGSFFAKFLSNISKEPNQIDTIKHKRPELLRPTTPICNIINCGDDSNDSEYSGSTINMEINKSISLFEDDPHEIERVRNMRELLNTSNIVETEDIFEVPKSSDLKQKIENKMNQPNRIINRQQLEAQNIACPECKKVVSFDQIATHADYHLALKLREEERQELRKEVKEKCSQKSVVKNEEQKSKPEDQLKSESCITNFLIKIDDNIPTEKCSECGKRIPVEQFAEHLDFHEAQKLSRELNRKPLVNNLTGSNVKRKKKSISPKRLKLPCRSIDSFFR